MIRTFARENTAVTDLERTNAAISRRVAAEGIVLLRNDGALPVAPGKIALFGEGASFTIKGGTGSGETNVRHVVGIREGLEKAGYTLTTTQWLDEYEKTLVEGKARYKAEMRKKAGWINFKAMQDQMSHPFSNPEGRMINEGDISPEAETCFYVVARQTGEGTDRKPGKGDFSLTDEEIANIKKCTQSYRYTVLVINVGGYMDLSPLDDMEIQGIVFFCQQGAEGGHAFADVVSGAVSPSGKLASSWPMKYEDIPFANEYSYINGNTTEEDYKEGIYVGYRYYDAFNVAPRYEFGFGLGYTTFATEPTVGAEGKNIRVNVKVRNTGSQMGKAVAQVYASCPQGRLEKECQRLAGYAKTETLKPGEEQTVSIAFDMAALASYDSDNSQTLLEKGDYILRVGQSSRDTVPAAVLRLSDDAVISRHKAICPVQRDLGNFCPRRTEVEKPDTSAQDIPVLEIPPSSFQTTTFEYNGFAPCADGEAARLLSTLTDDEKAEICVGSGLEIARPKPHFFIVPGAAGYSSIKTEKSGVPAISFCDGPAGVRLYDVSVTKGKTVRMVNAAVEMFELAPKLLRKLVFGNPKKGKLLYQYATAFPVGMSVAQTWNTPLAEEMGRSVQSEMEAFGAVYWLAPGMNIHRNPLCGRNYEYFSEDPLLSGMTAAAVTRGVQSKPGYFVTVKHYVANNQETNRMRSSSNLSERALREIYLRGFEIAVREGKAAGLMTSYNKINGVYAAESHDLCTRVLRNEWGFDGLVMTDWTIIPRMIDSAKAMQAGVNLMMPGIRSDRKQIKDAVKNKTLDQRTIDRNVSYLLGGIVNSFVYDMYKKS
jgi:beta-glucosidase